MIVSEIITHFYRGNGADRARQGEAGPGAGGNAVGEAVPARYRNQQGGIDIEQVRRDQQTARRRVVRELIRRVGEIWRRR